MKKINYIVRQRLALCGRVLRHDLSPSVIWNELRTTAIPDWKDEIAGLGSCFALGLLSGIWLLSLPFRMVIYPLSYVGRGLWLALRNPKQAEEALHRIALSRLRG